MRFKFSAQSSEPQDSHPTWTCGLCTLINPIDAVQCEVCESPRRRIETPAMALTISNTSEVSLGINSESRERIQDNRWLTDVKNAAFPTDHIAWLKGYERGPDQPLRQTYLKGIVQQDFDDSAPTIQVGIILLEGASKPTVTHAEMNRETRKKPNQKSPEWRVATAATLLKRFEVRDDLNIIRPDDSTRILEGNKGKTSLRRPRTITEQVKDTFTSSPRLGSIEEHSQQSLAKREIQDHPLNIDSSCIQIIDHDQVGQSEYDIITTLIEIDMQSICSLLANFKEVIVSGGLHVSVQDIMLILDTMINDVRRLCSRSPTLFRMATRSKISKSKDTRYGVDFGNVFATITTSEGIRTLIARSITYYLSLDHNGNDEEIVRPKFLQMLVLLLSLLNDNDLKTIAHLLEDTFNLPGDREGLELLILKVLPLESINTKVFMEDLLTACNYNTQGLSLNSSTRQKEQWQKILEDLADKGYILPGVIPRVALTDDFEEDMDDLMNELGLGDDRSSSTAATPQYPGSWRIPWPEKGIRDSRVFRHLQHSGKLKKEGNFQQETVTAVNQVPYFDVTSEDKQVQHEAIFANGDRFRIHCDDPENISAMKTAKYTLKEIESDRIVELSIVAEGLNESCIEATKQHNYLVDAINEYFGGRKEKKRNIFGGKPLPVAFNRLDEPLEATRVCAELVPQSGPRHLCAEAFKLGDRIVFREDILRDIGRILDRLEKNIPRIERHLPTLKIRAADAEIDRIQTNTIRKVVDKLERIKDLQKDASIRRQDLLQHQQPLLPNDPISSIIRGTFIETSKEKREWQPYLSYLSPDRQRLVIKSKILKVDDVGTENIMTLKFHGANLSLAVQPLTPPTRLTDDESSSLISPGDLVLWLGHFVVHVEPYANNIKSYVAQAYYRILWQKRETTLRINHVVDEKAQALLLV